MAQPGRPCPLCGLALGPGAPNEVLERHFQQCSKTDDRDAPRREWDDAADGAGEPAAASPAARRGRRHPGTP